MTPLAHRARCTWQVTLRSSETEMGFHKDLYCSDYTHTRLSVVSGSKHVVRCIWKVGANFIFRSLL